MSTDTRLVFNPLNGRLDAFLATRIAPSRMEMKLKKKGVEEWD